MTRTCRAALAVVVPALLVLGLVTPANAAPPSYLFVVDSPSITVKAATGDSAKVVIRGLETTRFADRPVREAERIGTRLMLEEFGWDAERERLRIHPNAAISIGGKSQIVEVRRARKSGDRLVLWVRAIDDALVSMRGTGSVFVDNAIPGVSSGRVVWSTPMQVEPAMAALATSESGGAMMFSLIVGGLIDGTSWSGGTVVASAWSPTWETPATLTSTTQNGRLVTTVNFTASNPSLSTGGTWVTAHVTQTLDGNVITDASATAFVESS